MSSIALIFSQLRNREKHSALQISPYELDPVSIVFIIIVFIARTLGAALGIGTAFVRLVSQNDSTPQEQLYGLPDLSIHMPLRLNTKCERTFAIAIEAEQHEGNHFSANKAQLCLYLASLTEPAMLMLLAKQGCPVRPLGAVNVRNRFELLEPELCRAICGNSNYSTTDEAREFSEELSTLSVHATFPRPARRVRRGIEIDVEVSLIADQIKSGSSSAGSKRIFRQEFTMLQFMKFHDKESTSTSKRAELTAITKLDKQKAFEVSMTAKQPYAWARLCKDYNPIHFSPAVAKLLGQPGQLAHGNHAVGICVQAMSSLANERRDPSPGALTERESQDTIKSLVLEKLESKSFGTNGWWLEVRFRRPVVLPAKFGPSLHPDGNGFDIVDGRSGKVSIEVSTGTI